MSGEPRPPGLAKFFARVRNLTSGLARPFYVGHMKFDIAGP